MTFGKSGKDYCMYFNGSEWDEQTSFFYGKKTNRGGQQLDCLFGYDGSMGYKTWTIDADYNYVIYNDGKGSEVRYNALTLENSIWSQIKDKTYTEANGGSGSLSFAEKTDGETGAKAKYMNDDKLETTDSKYTLIREGKNYVLAENYYRYYTNNTYYTINMDEETGSKVKNIVRHTKSEADVTYEMPRQTITNDAPEKDKDRRRGYLTIDKTEAETGETVTVTAHPNDGYIVSALYYNDGTNSPATFVKPNDGGNYVFKMPDYNVTVMAEFLHLVPMPKPDTTKFVYNGKEQTYYIEPSEYYEITDDKQTEAGYYEVEVSLKDEGHTAWDDDNVREYNTRPITYGFYIDKKPINYPEYEPQTFVYDGTE
ncbi:MAG: hypothetical protein MJ072_06275, partial [Clostridia bacterium]|nr:hypothetical protein [Clostridia bacterium]